MATIEYIFRIQAADWDFGGTVGTQKVLCYHQYVDASGLAVPEGDPAGQWEPFIPGPEIRGRVGDEVRVTVQNRIEDPMDEFVEGLNTGAIVHWHGVELANAHDGTPVTQKPIASGQDFTYKYLLHRPGVFWYHPHFDSLLQEHLGCYGPIVVEDEAHDELRSANVIPHVDRSYFITLSDISFQSGRTISPPDMHVPAANVSSTSPVYIRNILNVGGAENFGDVFLINGKHETPFNDLNGNFQQYWPRGERATAGPIVANEGESLAFQILNTGLHRFYKVQLAFSTVASPGPGDWTVSNDLFRIGGQGGLLDEALGGGGDFDQWRIRGRKGRNAAGATAVQPSSELLPGEYLIPTSARTVLAFEVGTGWTHVALRASGFSVQNGGHTDDENPANMEIARFAVSTTTDTTFKLSAPIAAGTPLLTNPARPSPAAQPSLATETAVSNFSTCTKAQLQANGIVVPGMPIKTDYAPELTQPGPSIDMEPHHWNATGPEQVTPNSTRYVNLGDVVEWTIETKTPGADHPWHIHGFSFQPIRIDLNTGAGYQPLYTWDFTEYVDSIYVPSHHRLTFRFRIEDRPYIGEDNGQTTGGGLGRWLAHCHITKHAHLGMMTNFIAVDACGATPRPHVDVFVRDQVSDDGSEPTAGVVSASPDIIMRPFEEADPQTAFGPASGTVNDVTLGSRAEFGQDNYIYVRMNNRGTQPAIASADVYWAQAATLLMPQNWNYIGTTSDVTVDPGALTVSDVVTWPEAQNPLAIGDHACLVTVIGSETDPRPITPAVAASFPMLSTFEDFRQFVRDFNNVAWRNFNVVDDILALTGLKSFPFIIRGAFDRLRRFDFLIENPFRDAVLELPGDERLRRALEAQGIKTTKARERMQLRLPSREPLKISLLPLEAGRDYMARFVIRDDAEAMLEKTIHIAQIHVEDYQDTIRQAKKDLSRAREALNREDLQDLAAGYKATIERLSAELPRLAERAKSPGMAPRDEVGRVSFHFTKPRFRRPPKLRPAGALAAALSPDELRFVTIVEDLASIIRRRM